MTKSSTTTVLPDKTVNIPLGELGSNLAAGLFFAALAVGGFLLPMFFPATWAIVVGWSLGALIACGLIFMPISVAMDVGDRIPEVKDARENDKELKQIEIRHPHLWAIVLLNVASFWSGVGWVVAMVWACSPGKVVIPDKVFAVVFGKNNPEEPKLDQPSSPPRLPVNPSLEEQLTEVNQLVDKGLLTKEEAEERKTLILKR
jgi:4-hydroxybenzoate polyprenyltransferase